MIGIGFTVLQATGLMDQVHRLYESEVKTRNLLFMNTKWGMTSSGLSCVQNINL